MNQSNNNEFLTESHIQRNKDPFELKYNEAKKHLKKIKEIRLN